MPPSVPSSFAELAKKLAETKTTNNAGDHSNLAEHAGIDNDDVDLYEVEKSPSLLHPYEVFKEDMLLAAEARPQCSQKLASTSTLFRHFEISVQAAGTRLDWRDDALHILHVLANTFGSKSAAGGRGREGGFTHMDRVERLMAGIPSMEKCAAEDVCREVSSLSAHCDFTKLPPFDASKVDAHDGGGGDVWENGWPGEEEANGLKIIPKPPNAPPPPYPGRTRPEMVRWMNSKVELGDAAKIPMVTQSKSKSALGQQQQPQRAASTEKCHRPQEMAECMLLDVAFATGNLKLDDRKAMSVGTKSEKAAVARPTSTKEESCSPPSQLKSSAPAASVSNTTATTKKGGPTAGPKKAPSSKPVEGPLTGGELIEFAQLVLPDDDHKHTLVSHLLRVISSPHRDEHIQGELLDLLGVEHVEFVARILANRRQLAEQVTEEMLRARKAKRQVMEGVELLLTARPQLNTIEAQAVRIQSGMRPDEVRRLVKQEKKMKKQMKKLTEKLDDEERTDYELALKGQEKQREQEETEQRLQAEAIQAVSASIAADRSRRRRYPHVYDAFSNSVGDTQKSSSSLLTDFTISGTRFALPEGSKRRNTHLYEEVYVPAPAESGLSGGVEATRRLLGEDFRPVRVSELDPLGRAAFEGITQQLNPIQSVVFPAAYNSLENLLICAPTGAGKTNIAMLAVLRTLRDHATGSNIDLAAFKIVYVAPMKALAAEITKNFSLRLAKLGVKVRELTGDMQLSKKEIKETQMLVVTPEKWDVVTRKVEDEALTQLVRLLIIDEVHLLQDERGPVLEAVVARTFRQLEVYHQNVRVVGLSATLPNYVDVAKFLRVDPMKGLYFFDARFRPVPLQQTFVGVHLGQCRAQDFQRQQMDEACYEKCMGFLRDDHQVLVFVHSRNATSQLARFFADKSSALNERALFMPSNCVSAGYLQAVKSMRSAKSRELEQLFAMGMGIHHAGLVRSDRTLMERMFGDGRIRCMFCTATLAWGVNLPAHAVVIRGTEIFDPQKGVFNDIGVLDVQQIFGRAGRPQYSSQGGHGIIITTAAKIPKYLEMLVRQVPIESQFPQHLADNLNAEVARGTVSTLGEAVDWLRHTYFYIRASINPLAYGLHWDHVRDDPQLGEYLTDLCHRAAQKLDTVRMLSYDSMNGYLSATDQGRIASNFYISYETIERVNGLDGGQTKLKLSPLMTDDVILDLISSASEFEQIKARESEMADLEAMANFGCALPIRGGGLATSQGKTNCLLQNYISRNDAHGGGGGRGGGGVPNFALVSETHYILQNAPRIARALFEVVLRRGWAAAAQSCLAMAKCIQCRLWPFNSPLRQLVDADLMRETTVRKIENRAYGTDRLGQLLEMEPGELGALFSVDGVRLKEVLNMLPRVEFTSAEVKPITHTIIKVEATLVPNFTWNDRLLGSGAPQRYWLLLEDVDEHLLLHYEQLLITKRQVAAREEMRLVLTVPIRQHQQHHRYLLRATNDTFIDAGVGEHLSSYPLAMHNCVWPSAVAAHTDLLDLDPLPVGALRDAHFEALYTSAGVHFFNPIQSQVFHSLYETDECALIGAPTSSGKTLCAELAVFRMLNRARREEEEESGEMGKGNNFAGGVRRMRPKCVYIAPLKALVRERMADWTEKFANRLGLGVVEVSGDCAPELDQLNSATILVTTPEKWDGISRCAETRSYVRSVQLMIIDEIHLLGVERGAVLEAIVTRVQAPMARRRRQLAAATTSNPSLPKSHPTVRVIGLSTALANAHDVGAWLGVKDECVYNFRPSVRPVPVQVHIQGFAGRHYCPRMALMNRPIYRVIKQFSPTKPVLIFVASRRQTRLTAMALLSLLSMEANPKQWLHTTDDAEIQAVVDSVQDDNLRITLPFGVGLHHAGLQLHERRRVEKLFAEQKIQILVATATLAWGINLPAHLVVVKGTEYYDGRTHKYVDFPVTDVLQMIGRAGRPQFDTSAVAVVMVQDVKKEFYKRFLYEPFPVESSLLPVLANHVNAEICSGSIDSKQRMVEYISGTYLYRRLFANPSYYGIENFSAEGMVAFLKQIADKCADELTTSGCIAESELVEEAGRLQPTYAGQLASKYYLDHRTLRHFAAHITADSSVETLLGVLADSPEYEEIPVRHNENLTNRDLQRTLPIRLDPATVEWDSPHTKTHLLYQAHFSRARVPVDYATDQLSVLESCARILRAMLDYSLWRGWLATSMNCLLLQQQVAQARWYFDAPLLCLPHIEDHSVEGLGPRGMIVPQLQEELGVYGAEFVPEEKVKTLARRLMKKTILEEKEAREVIKALLQWPLVKLSQVRLLQTNAGVDGSTYIPPEIPIDLMMGNSDAEKGTSISLRPNATYRLRVKLELFGVNRNKSTAYCPKFPKPKRQGWVIMLAEKNVNAGDGGGRVLAHHLYTQQPDEPQKLVRLQFSTPAAAPVAAVDTAERSTTWTLSLIVASDCYLGIDQEYELRCVLEDY